MLAQRNGPGDLEAAAARAERAVQAEPKLVMAHLVKLNVAMARSQWSIAIATLETLERKLGTRLSEEQRDALPNAAGLLSSPEYTEWRKHRP